MAHFYRRLASFASLILLDKRGIGLSDRVPPDDLPGLEQRMDDLRAVLDAAGSERSAVIGASDGGPMAALFAASHPQRTTALILVNTYARRLRAEDYPWAPTIEQREELQQTIRAGWGRPLFVDLLAPSLADDPAFRSWWASFLRQSVSPGAAVAMLKTRNAGSGPRSSGTAGDGDAAVRSDVTAGPIRYARSGGLDIAYQVLGAGPIDIVAMVGWVSHLEVALELPEVAHFVERLANMGRVVVFDKRGTGLSDRPTTAASVDEMVPDLLAVMDAVGMEQPALLGWVDTAALAMTFAAHHPERVRALVLGEALATATRDEDHPWGPDPSIIGALADVIEGGHWGEGVLLPLIAPSLADDQRILGWFRRLERMSATPNMAANLLRLNLAVDLRPILDRVTAPALVIHRRDSPFLPAEAMRWLADHLPDGRYVEVPGDQTPGFLGDVDALMDEVEDFLLGTRTGGASVRRVTTVLFSDVVASTELAAALGDRRWHDLLETHRVGMRRLLGRHAGTEVDTAGDGFLITFDSPTSAIRCALAMTAASETDGLTIRIGLHTGEVIQQGKDITGMAVHIGARIAGLASGGEVLASSTVREMVIGSGFAFSPRGRHPLKGVPGEWELFSVER